jgi:hypothetical protein
MFVPHFLDIIDFVQDMARAHRLENQRRPFHLVPGASGPITDGDVKGYFRSANLMPSQ